MNQTTENRGYRVRRNHFPIPMFLITFLVLLMMGGIHYGVTLWVNVMTENHVIRTTVVILYWVLVSASLTLLTRWQMKKTYDRGHKPGGERGFFRLRPAASHQ